MSDAAGRVRHEGLRQKIISAEQAAEFIQNGMTVGISGFTGAGYPKAVPGAVAAKAEAAHAKGEAFKIRMITGASTADECDGVLARANAIEFRSPFQSDPTLRNQINAGDAAYMDVHLSHIEQQVRAGFFGEMDVALIEVAGITEDGKLIPSLGVGTNVTWLQKAKKVILEVNARQNEKLEGMADIYDSVGLAPFRKLSR